MIAFFAFAVPIGTLLHTGPAAAAGLPVRRGWATAAGLLAYGVLVAAMAATLAPFVPNSTGGRHGPDVRAAGEGSDAAPPRISNALLVTGVIGWAVGGIVLAILVLASGISALVD
jgi:hypothetical protein